ncbi:MAG TPA: DUF2207 domain-containing protein, partial [Mycobacterium sp.]|nr:DUF2207 domain-containing protein [Mycobacterium sp.]
MPLVVVLVGTAVLAVLLGVLRPITLAKQLILSAVLVALSILGMLWPLAQQSYSAKVAHAGDGPLNDWQSTIDNYDATYRVAAGGRLEATEVLAVDLPAGRHGIFRFFPVADPTDPHARIVPTVTGVTMDDRPVPVSYSWRAARTFYVAQIGDPDATVSPGVHTYTIDYTIDGALVKAPAAPGDFATRAGDNPAPPAASFYYNVVGFWAMKINAAR